MFYGILLAVLVLVSVFLVIFILMQSDKGGGLAGAFGGMGGSSMPFSGREAATILTKLTTILAISFMVICVVLSLLSRNRATVTSSDSALQKRAQKMQKMESRSAASALDQNMLPPSQGAEAPGAPGAAPAAAPGRAEEAFPAEEAAPAPSPVAPAAGKATVNIPGVTQTKQAPVPKK